MRIRCVIAIVIIGWKIVAGFSTLSSRVGFISVEKSLKQKRFLCKNDLSPSKTDEISRIISLTNKAFVSIIKDILSSYYGDRHYQRFAALETIARVPYFSYTSVLHLYETLGLRRKKDCMKIHFAESWNELHHLLVRNKLTAYM